MQAQRSLCPPRPNTGLPALRDRQCWPVPERFDSGGPEAREMEIEQGSSSSLHALPPSRLHQGGENRPNVRLGPNDGHNERIERCAS